MHIQDEEKLIDNKGKKNHIDGNRKINPSGNRTARAKRERRKQLLLLLCYIVLIGLCGFFIWKMEAGREGSQRETPPLRSVIVTDQEPDGSMDLDGNTGSALAAGDITLESLHSPYVILLDAESGQVLAEKNSAERMYPASMTKLMAALVAVEHTEDWSTTVEIPYEIFSKLYVEHASLAGFEPEEKVTPQDLLYGMLLPSGAECCTTYAMWLAGDEGTFVEWMNLKAMELGMENTHFTNTTGLHDEEHYSTAEDMAILLSHCLQDDQLRTVLMAEMYQTVPTPQHSEGLTLESTLFQAINQSKALTQKLENCQDAGVTLLGGKTGYTSQAGLCLASFASIGGREYILVTAGAEGNHYTQPFHIEDALTVYGQLVALVKG